jgi:PKD repeat protein
VRAKVWRVGATEPTGWQVTTTDGTAALQQAGSIGLSLYLGGTATTLPVTAAFDDLWAGPTAPPPPPPPPANVAPTAAFTVSASGLTANVDAATSRDTDGTITGHAWTFGDGGTASGAQQSHLYSAGGTYPVTLTVTDDDGATATSTQSVTVSPPPAGGAVARDAFERTVVSGLGSAEVGGAWTTTGSASNYTVTQGAATLRSPAAGAMETAQLAAVKSTSTDVRIGVAVQQPATGSGTYLSLLGRTVGSDDYRARVRLNADGTVTLQTMRGGTALRTLLVAGLTPAVGDKLTIRLQVTGAAPTTVRAKVWASAQTEPSAWQLEGTDATPAMQVPGGVGVALYLGGTATNAPATARFDDLIAGAVP